MKVLSTAMVGLAATCAHASRDFYTEATIRTPTNTGVTYKQPIGGGIYQPIITAQQTVMNELRAALQGPLLEMIKPIEGYQSGYVIVNGPISLNYRLGEVSFSGPQVSIGATVKRSYAGVSATCNIALDLDNGTTFSGHVNLDTGVVDNLQIQNFKLNSSYNCSSSLDWVPVVGELVNLAIDHFVDQAISNAVKGAYNKLDQINHYLAPLSFMSLDLLSLNVPGELAAPLGYIKNRIASGFQNIQSMQVVIGDPKRRVYGPTGYAHEAASHDGFLGIYIDGYSFEVSEHRYYYDEMYCPPPASGRSCFRF
ncbi:hypothetical protein [Roseateles sp.]|uniref:hypothetical protein n=1 Tax=Roseateles sp. TaxID=1971397 RepID=UPI0031D814DB